jgi:hypothetical protein
MLWIYRRGSDSLRVQTRFDKGTEEYVLVTYREDGTEREERFNDPDAFQTRLATFEAQLGRERWQSDCVRLLSDGWKI